jgi:hypothetical protein
MEPASTPETPLDLEPRTDEELFELLPVKKEKEDSSEKEERMLTSQQRRALDELWRRHWETVKEYLKAKIFACGSTLCPPEEPDKEHFLDMCFNETYQVFLRRTCRKEYRSFGAFLYTMALNVTLDVRKYLTGRPGEPVEVIRGDDATKNLVDERRGPLQIVAARELRDLFDDYAALSPENGLSLRVGRLKRGEDMTWEETLEIIDKLFPGEVLGPTLGARIKSLRDFEKHDTKNILPWLQERKITDPFVF